MPQVNFHSNLCCLSMFLFLQTISPSTIASINGELTFFMPEESPIQEVSAAILKRAYRTIGYEVSFTKLPNVRSLTMSQLGRSDGEVSRISSISTNSELIKVPFPIQHIEGYLFVQTNHTPKTKINPSHFIKENKIACIRGVKFIEFELKKQRIDCLKVEHFSQAFRLLRNNRVKGLVSPKINTEYYIRNEPTIHRVKPALVTDHLYHFINSKHEKLVDPLVTILKSMKNNGEMAAIKHEILKYEHFRNRTD